MLGGLSLGREGPSIQLGAMAGQGISRALGRGKREEKFLMTCGASAGLSAAFHAPLAGMMFAVEEIHKTFSIPILLPVMTASVTADYIASHILGLGISISDHEISAAKLLLAFDPFGNFGRCIRCVL